MRYLTYTPALNLASPLKTDGDWHYSSIDWSKAKFEDSDDSVFGDWGLYAGDVPEHGTVMIADHIRALLDMLEHGYFGSAQGMRESFINNEAYTPIIFEMVMKLRESDRWAQIDSFMGKEYLCDWLDYKKGIALHETA